ncbi:MAG: type IIA DNA topoisomerase subunit B [Candidatus Paceibacterota bacterium]
MSKSGDINNYSASSLQVLEGLDAVRKRPGMYIGSTDSRGLQHCLWEIVDNAVDEALAGYCDTIEITVHPDNSIEVSDNGRGIPTDIEPKTKLTGVEVVFTKLHAGGKFGGGSYQVSGGLHGVGASVVNALSKRLDVLVHREGFSHYLSFKNGIPGQFDNTGNFSTKPMRKEKNHSEKKTGTTVRYWPDFNIFLPTAEIDINLTHERARQTAFLVPGLKIIVKNLKGAPSTEIFHFQGGMRDLVEYISSSDPVNETLHITGSGDFVESIPVLKDGVLVTEDVSRTCGVEIAIRYNVGYESEIKSFVNIIATPKGGTHVQGFERALVKTINEALKENKILKNNEQPIIKEDALEGLTAVVLVRLSEPQFEGQTKEILGTSAVTAIVTNVLSDALASFFADPRKKNAARAVLEKVANASRARIAARAQRDTIRRKNALESSSLPAKLSDCRSDDFELSELFIIEGDSAGGTVKAARDAEYQALMPIRGKILNTMRASEKQMLENQECAAIIAAMGAGSGKSFNIDNIRYGKLIVLADADVDGAHIRCLLLTLAHRYMEPLLKAGRVYSAIPPLFRVTTSSNVHTYCYSDEERDQVVAKLNTEGKKIKEIQRYKGLGEMDADQLSETTLDKSKRKLRQMTVEDAQEAENTFEMLMGNDVAARKEFIVVNGGLIPLDRIDA